MPSAQAEINRDLYNQVNSMGRELSETNGFLKSIVDQNERLIKLLRLAILTISAFAGVCLLALVYGAVGRDGLKAVRETSIVALPPHDDSDKWHQGRRMS